MRLTTIERKRFRVRKKLKNVSKDRYRLSVSRSTKNISAQIIDDVKNITLVSASSIDKEIKIQKKNKKEYLRVLYFLTLPRRRLWLWSTTGEARNRGCEIRRLWL